MAMTLLGISRHSVAILIIGVLGCASDDLLLPDPPGGGENVHMSKLRGDGQEGTVGEQLPEPVAVQILSPRELPVVGREVAFVITSTTGEVSPDTAVTNSEGTATAHWVLGNAPGQYTIQARLVGDTASQSLDFTAQAKPAAPDTLSPWSPLTQPGRRGQSAATSPVVRVVDRFGNAVPDVLVAWQVTSGEGTTSQPLTRTASDGITTVDWILGNRIGVHKLTATIEQASGSPVTFTATVLF